MQYNMSKPVATALMQSVILRLYNININNQKNQP